MIQTRVLSASVLVHLSLAACALAQTGPNLLIRPLPEDAWLETASEVVILEKGHTDNADADFQLTLYDTAGRIRERAEHFQPRLGYDLTYLDIDTDDPLLPDRLVDTSVAAGFALPNFEGFIGGLTVGVGYAGDTPFGDPQAFYGKATAVFGRTIDETSEIGFVLDYDGNRTVYPDIPLPGFAYRKQIDPTLLLAVGLPLNTLEWRATDELTVELIYALIDRLDVRVTYDVSEQFGLFATFDQRREAFELDELDDHDRLLYEQRRVEAGVRWEPTETTALLLAGGYAFAQEFGVGFDFRETEEVADVSDEPYVRIAFEARF